MYFFNDSYSFCAYHSPLFTGIQTMPSDEETSVKAGDNKTEIGTNSMSKIHLLYHNPAPSDIIIHFQP